ncbi:hypothetical protein BC936DRAFT_140340 [Jimgerdemannia flammicorona]|uniref:Uncharacterized protein n=1 Tax=Jimgerdemannia flammicorona TaxID=994334 RepID=A0A433DGW5_9FUNG|nr:hypothetical protein BC936DRAFT_140340 [Jimgerdemannia flammicorona]
MAELYQSQGKCNEVEQLYQQALVICRIVVGPEYMDIGKHDAAESLSTGADNSREGVRTRKPRRSNNYEQLGCFTFSGAPEILEIVAPKHSNRSEQSGYSSQHSG